MLPALGFGLITFLLGIFWHWVSATLRLLHISDGSPFAKLVAIDLGDHWLAAVTSNLIQTELELTKSV